MSQGLKRKRDDGGGYAGAAARDDRLRQIDAGIRKSSAQRIEILEPALVGEYARGQAPCTWHMARPHARPRLRFLAGEAPGAARIGNLGEPVLDHIPHALERGDRVRVEDCVESLRAGFRNLGRRWPAVRFPAVHPAIENEDVLGAHDSEHPPDPRGGEDPRAVVDDDRVVLADSHCAHGLGECLGRGQGVRQRARPIGDRVLVEEDRPGNVRGGVFGFRVAVLRRQIPGGIDYLDRRIIEALFKPIRRNDKAALVFVLTIHRRHSTGLLM